MFVVGLSGDIGSGKTAASDRFEHWGIDVIDADIAARVVVDKGRPALDKIAEHFGQDILLEDGNLDRATLRRRIFSDQDEKIWLESLLHPLIADQVFASLANAKSPYAILVSPLLIESSQDLICDRVLIIDVPEQLQIERTVQRDNNEAEQVKRIIASQTSRQLRLEKATEVIQNTAGIKQLEQQVDTLHQLYLEMAVTHNHQRDNDE